MKYTPTAGITEKFWLFDSGATPGRILIFGRPRAIGILNSCSVLFGDGTFDVVPKLFYQMFVIFGSRFGTVTPFLFALLPNKKTKDTYRALFTAIKDMGGDFQSIFFCDYEVAEMK